MPERLSLSGTLDVLSVSLGTVANECQVEKLITELSPFVGKKATLHLKTGIKQNSQNGNQFTSTFIEVLEPKAPVGKPGAGTGKAKFVPKTAGINKAASQVNRVNSQVTED